PLIFRDSHGFKRPTQWIKIRHLHQFDQYYEPIIGRQHQYWNRLLSKYKNQWPPLDAELKRCARNGIPSNLRGSVWLYYTDTKAKMEANQELYESLVNTADSMGDHNEYAEIIQRDLHRTFPDNSKFSCTIRHLNGSIIMMPETNSKLQSLRRILLAFSIHSPHIGYCQSLNYLAGFFLLFVDNEEEAFWMLVTTVHDYFPENMYDSTMEGANIDQAVLMMFVYEKMPGIWNKMTGGKDFWESERTDGLPSITLVTCHWFLTIFINILPVETVLRIWDCFFIEGYHILLRVSLSLIKMNEERIWTLQDPSEIFQILQNMPRRLIDCHQFMDYVFSSENIFSDIDMEQIELRRKIYREQRRQRL
ncbi:TBC-domain-containing protein, partial [Backusella circina FSU 941]